MDFTKLENTQKEMLSNINSLNLLLHKIEDKKVEPMKQIISELNVCLSDFNNPNNLEKLYALNERMINSIKK